MKHDIRKWATPAIIGTGLFVSASGVLIFFGLRDPLEQAHEWIGLAFFAAILIHVWNHWRSFRNYFPRRLTLAIVGAVAVVASIFAVAPGEQGKGGNPMMQVVRSFENSPLLEVAPLLDQKPDDIVRKLKTAGLKVEGIETSLSEIAASNGTEPRRLMHLLFEES